MIALRHWLNPSMQSPSHPYQPTHHLPIARSEGACAAAGTNYSSNPPHTVRSTIHTHPCSKRAEATATCSSCTSQVHTSSRDQDISNTTNLLPPAEQGSEKAGAAARVYLQLAGQPILPVLKNHVAAVFLHGCMPVNSESGCPLIHLKIWSTQGRVDYRTDYCRYRPPQTHASMGDIGHLGGPRKASEYSAQLLN